MAGSLHGLPPCPVAEWVIPPAEQVRQCWREVYALYSRPRDAVDKGACDAMAWITVGEQSPLTRRWAAGSTLADGRGESWLALCLAADQSLPTEQDWERLGVERRPPITHDWEYAYGVWRVLAWATGARKDVPILRGWHAAAETGRGEPAREDALRHWRHIRRLADSTASHGSSTG